MRAGLPVDCEIESDKPVPGAPSSVTSKPSSPRKPKRSHSEDNADAIQTMKGLDGPPEIIKRRQEMLVESEEARHSHTALVYE